MFACAHMCIHILSFFLFNSGKIVCIFVNEKNHCLLAVNKGVGDEGQNWHIKVIFRPSQTAHSLRLLPRYLLMFCSHAARQWNGLDSALLSPPRHSDGAPGPAHGGTAARSPSDPLPRLSHPWVTRSRPLCPEGLNSALLSETTFSHQLAPSFQRGLRLNL